MADELDSARMKLSFAWQYSILHELYVRSPRPPRSARASPCQRLAATTSIFDGLRGTPVRQMQRGYWSVVETVRCRNLIDLSVGEVCWQLQSS